MDLAARESEPAEALSGLEEPATQEQLELVWPLGELALASEALGQSQEEQDQGKAVLPILSVVCRTLEPPEGPSQVEASEPAKEAAPIEAQEDKEMPLAALHKQSEATATWETQAVHCLLEGQLSAREETVCWEAEESPPQSEASVLALEGPQSTGLEVLAVLWEVLRTPLVDWAGFQQTHSRVSGVWDMPLVGWLRDTADPACRDSQVLVMPKADQLGAQAAASQPQNPALFRQPQLHLFQQLFSRLWAQQPSPPQWLL